MENHLEQRYPHIAARVPRLPLAELPTPLEQRSLRLAGTEIPILVKRDDLSGSRYGGNKVRKLEYLLQRARERGVDRVATFGAVGSNHALATALYGTANGFECTCFLSHQHRNPKIPLALNMHLHLGTEIVRYGGSRAQRVATLRRHLGQRRTWLIPAGGSCWLGALGFVNAGLELADQLAAGGLPPPARLYVANGTMGTVAGLALGLALAELPTEIQAVRVTDANYANPTRMRKLIAKTATVMQHVDASVPAALDRQVRLRFREGFFAGGYAHTDERTERAIRAAREQPGLELESTYTGKAMAALLHDAQQADLGAGSPPLFWNTYNSHPLPVGPGRPADTSALPEEFLSYFD